MSLHTCYAEISAVQAAEPDYPLLVFLWITTP
jgi:hypothetical protein